MRIEPMTAAHLDGIAAIERECFAHPWTRDDLEAALNNDNSVFLAATENGEVIGYIGAEVIIDEGYIYNVAVTEKRRGQGVGSRLMETVLARAQTLGFSEVTIGVDERETQNVRLYRRFGFVRKVKQARFDPCNRMPDGRPCPDDFALLMKVF